MHQRDSDWFLPCFPHTSITWSTEDDGRLRVSVDLNAEHERARAVSEDTVVESSGVGAPATGLPETGLQGADMARSGLPATGLPGIADPTEPVEARIHRMNSEATQGVAANDNPHEDTRGLQPVVVPEQRFSLRAPGLPRYLGISRSRDGVLFDIPLDEVNVPGDGMRARVYGLGEKTGGLDKRGRTWLMWNSDDPTHSPDKSALYQSQPVAYLWTPRGTVTIFVDSRATVWFDAGEAEPDRLLIEVYDTQFDLYLRADPDLPAAVNAYTALTGRIPLPPEWALGFQQCRYSYFPEERVLEVAQRFRQEQVPCDVIYLDIHYMDGYRVFTWDRRRFPDPARMIRQLRDEGFRVVTIVDPGVKRDADYPVFASGREEDLFLRAPDGTIYTGRVWPGDAVFPDFSRAATRSWWARWHRELFDVGVDGIWNDMNEPADFTGDLNLRVNFTVPDDLIADNEGDPCSFGRVHNGYANGMNRATREAFARFRPEERGFVLTRAGSAGVQRDAAIWTGDNHSWWEHLGMMIPMFCNVGLSGGAFVGGDAGGFQLNADGELYSRWVAAAAFTPFFRAHSALDTRDHEPWSFGARALAIARAYIGMRYRLMPYVYTLFEEASRTGAPVMRPLVWEFPADPRVDTRADSFMLGDAILVAPVREPGVQERSVYLPAGTWYDFWTGERLDIPAGSDGSGRAVTAEAPLERLPLYLRGGRIVPFESVRQHTGEPGDGVLRLLVVPDGAGRAAGEIYIDAGEGFGYREGQYRRIGLFWEGDQLSVDGEPRPSHLDAAVNTTAASVRTDGESLSDDIAFLREFTRWRGYAVVPVAPVTSERHLPGAAPAPRPGATPEPTATPETRGAGESTTTPERTETPSFRSVLDGTQPA